MPKKGGGLPSEALLIPRSPSPSPYTYRGGMSISSPIDLVIKGLAVDLFTSISTNSLFCYSFIQQPSLGRLSNFERWVLTLSKPVGQVDKQRKASKCEKMMHWPRSYSKYYHLMPNPSLTTEYLNLSLILVCHSNLYI